MNVFTFVVILVTIVLCARLIQVYLEQKKTDDRSADELEQTIAKMDRLEERIQVLERIITENRFDLKKQIDNL
jgi:phage shock protein B